MFKRLAWIILVCLMLLNSYSAYSQDSQVFSSDPALFVSELEVLFRQAQARQRQEATALLSNIRQAFNTGLVSSEDQQLMIGIANRMQTFRLKAFPHFFAYFSAAMVYNSLSSDRDNFVEWNKSVHKLIAEGTERQIQNYLEKSFQFFREGLLFSSNSVQWRFRGGEWANAPDSLPYFTIRNATLVCYASRDSLNIQNASGNYFPVSDDWFGTKGRINWERAGYSADEVYADFSDHTIKLSNSFFTADSAWFRFPEYFNRPLNGSINHRVVTGTPQTGITYPRFYSYNFFHEIREIFPGIDFSGGFGLEGSRVIGLGKDRNNGQLIIKRNGEQIARFNSHSFVIRKDRITSQRASFCLFLDGDSIYHPGLQMRYLDQDREIMLLRTGDGLAQSPYFNSYHHLDMLFEAMYWNPDTDEITFGAMRGLARESEATFESDSYFTTSRFNRVQGADARHPLIIIHNFVRSLNSNTFYHEDLATLMNLSIEQVSATLISLANQGFIQYSPDDGKVVVKDRVRHYIDAVNDRSDYDVIRINSKVEGLVNARLNLKTFDMEIYGAPEIYLSNTQKVFVYPANSTITMKKGLDFLFKGRIHAGYFKFYAQESAFLYDAFKLNLTQIDSLSFDVPVEGDLSKFQEQLERVKTVISNISGELLIDHPTNKSGRKIYPRYPIFDSKNDSYVYFDEPHIQNGVYTRDNFYYHILPFTIDSLNNFTTIGMSFNGYLHSGSIFPEISEPLRVQPDYSLGFVKEFISEGLPLYDGQAKAFLEISLSHQGLRGGGRIEYLTSVSYSDDFLLHPDSVMAMLSEFDLQETIGDVSYPAVFVKDVDMKWVPAKDIMLLRSTKNIPFEMYDKQLVHRGTITLRSSGLFGSGELSYADALFRSVNFNFHHNAFGSDNSTFTLASPAFGLVFRASQYGFEYDLEYRQGRFQKSKDYAGLEFPLNQYNGKMDEFRWETDYEEIFFTDNDPLTQSQTKQIRPDSAVAKDYPVNFISINPDQDSLRFPAGAARFDLREYMLEIQEIPFIEVADVMIIPVDGKATVLRGAEMKQLLGGSLIANTTSRFHRLYNVTVTINGRRDYTATGMYDYTDVSGKTQPIFFNRLAPGSDGITTGTAHVSDLGFALSPFFDFIGNIKFTADKEEFYYDGGFRIRHTCSEANPHWVKFHGEVDKQKVVLPVEDPPADVHGAELSAALLFSPVNSKVYSGFLLGKQYPGDHALFSASGEIYFDSEKQQYIIGKDAGKQSNDAVSGNLNLNIDRCILNGEGKITFGENLGKVSMTNSGSFNYFMLPDSVTFNLFTTLDFFIDPAALEFLNQSITAADLTGMDPGSKLFLDGLKNMLSESDAQRLISELSLYGTFRRFPRELSQTMILSDVQLKWNNNTRSFVSHGPIGIATLNNQAVFRYVQGYIELVRRRTGDAVTVYFEPTPGDWYFFSYSAGIMQVISSNEDFNNYVMNIREDRRTMKTKANEELYQYIISTTQQRNAFLRRMRGN